MESFADARNELWENKTEYRYMTPMLEYIFAALFSLEEDGANVQEIIKAVAELDEYLYERTDV